MSNVHATRSLLGPADPARDVVVAPPRRTALEVIALAPAVRRARPTRRLVLAAGAATVAAGAVAVVASRSARPLPPSGPEAGLVLEPIAYQYDSGAPPAGPRLRALADAITDAPYETHAGRYAYHQVRIWGDPVESDSSGHVMGFASEERSWIAADGSGQHWVRQLEPEFPDRASRDYWQSRLPRTLPPPATYPLPPTAIDPLPTDAAGLARLLQVRYGLGAADKFLAMVYTGYLVPRPVRAQILRVLADLPGLLWRGTVTDRAGRPGVAVTADDPDHGQQSVLVLDPTTGVLRATELLTLRPKRISTYLMVLATDRTDRPGP
jgi:hypothetical protein